LRDLVSQENLEADDDALALLAEAGDGSMRDALSILDQAIASASGRVTADSVRNLVGAAPAHILEQVMQAVAEGKSEEVLRQVDNLISEGHSPTHFARQMVRFLRNATVGKVAGKDSPLLQVSSEERDRVGRVAELFGEEDLTRHLQIMLRTHGELGYKQEQRFHLELGLLKMAHAQRLLPIEQLLSEVTPAATGAAQRSAARPSIVASAPVSEARRSELPAARANFVSPFAADSARKGTPRQEASFDSAAPSGPRIVAGTGHAEPVIMGSAAPMRGPEPSVVAMPQPIPALPIAESVTKGDGAAGDLTMGTSAPSAAKSPAPTQPALQPPAGAPTVMSSAAPSAPTSAQPELDRLQAGVLQALTDGNQRVLVSMLSDGEWSVAGNELIIKIAESQTVVDMSLGPEAKRLAVASASGVMGRPMKLKVVPGATVAPQDKKRAVPSSGGPGGRGRAEQDPVVRRMQEKFGAQIRTVIDYRDKR
jgi:DNA polymerase III subunit gamma/tau